MNNSFNSQKPTLRSTGRVNPKEKSVAAAVLPFDSASASPVPRAAPKRWFWRWLRIIAAVVLGLAFIGGLGVTWFCWIAWHSLPQVDGTVRALGLSAEVRVIRDTRGVPHILAANTKDLFFAQGYVTAQDRLWQTDMSRRLADGTASEVMGAAFLQYDEQQRILGLRGVAERSWQALSARDRSHFDAYARGVNAFVESHRTNLPIEFRILRYSPKPWTGVDSLLCGLLMNQGLNHGLYETKLVREKFTSRLGTQLAADLYPNSSWRDHPPGVDGRMAIQQNPSSRAGAQPGESSVRAEFPRSGDVPDNAQVPGSNSWVISGAHTVTGKPLLSNDMHLVFRIPNTWYEVHLEVHPQGGEPGFDVVGFTLPGLPYVLVGHNERIAWGFTNLLPDVEDIFVENVRSDGQYQTPDGWKPMERRHEVISVKGEPDVSFDVMLTRHGPVVTDLVDQEKRILALKWSIYDEPVTVPFFDLDAAHNWQEFREALSHFSGPAQNVVYADADGHIGYQAAGRIPIRKSGDGSIPVSGTDNAHEWIGYIPFDKLPSTYDPLSGVLATANGRVTPDRYPYSISTQWGSPYRTERIYQVLNSHKKFAAEDMLELQVDTYSAFDRFCAERFASAVSHSANPSARARKAGELMQQWNGWVSAEMPAPTLVAQTRQQLLRLLLESKLKTASGASGNIDWTDYQWLMSSVALENIIAQQPPRWLPSSYASYDELILAAVEKAVDQKDAPRDLASWKWGGQVPVHLQHPIFGKIPILDRWSGPGPVAQSGDRYTVKQTGSTFGPSERMTVDFANFDGSSFNILTGQSGQLFSPYYMNQWQAWYQGSRVPMPFSDDAVIKTKTHELSLIPQ